MNEGGEQAMIDVVGGLLLITVCEYRPFRRELVDLTFQTDERDRWAIEDMGYAQPRVISESDIISDRCGSS